MSQLLEEVQNLVEKYERRLVQYAHSVTHDLDHARDIVQDAFIKFLNSRSDGEKIMNSKAWLYRVTYNKSIDLIRKNKRYSELECDVRESVLTPSTPSRPDHVLQNKDNVEWLKKQLDSLGEKEMDIFRMKIYEEKSYKEIAEELGISVGHVGILLHRIMKKLSRDKDEITSGGIK
ncbi:MAG: RNA polymerase sigma factor [Lentisphaeraceae bacterium]|nr:RNA polymerase sigma factor [Lentisphaeraceae bacterium]